MSELTSKKSKKNESKHKDSETKDNAQKRYVSRDPHDKVDKSHAKDQKKISKEDNKSLKSQKTQNSSHNRKPNSNSSKNTEKKGSDNKKLRQKSQETFIKDTKPNDKQGPIQKHENKLLRTVSQGLVEIGNPSGSENESESSTQDTQSYEYEDFSTSEEVVDDADQIRKSTFDSFFESIKDSSPNNYHYHKMPNEVELISAQKKSSETLPPDFFFSQQPEDSGYKLNTSVNDEKLLKNIDNAFIVTDSITIDVFGLEQNMNYNLSSNEDSKEFKSLPPQMQTSLCALQECFSGISSIVKGLVNVSGHLYKSGPDDFRFENEFQAIEKGYGKYNSDKSFRQFVEQDFGEQIKSILDV